MRAEIDRLNNEIQASKQAEATAKAQQAAAEQAAQQAAAQAAAATAAASAAAYSPYSTTQPTYNQPQQQPAYNQTYQQPAYNQTYQQPAYQQQQPTYNQSAYQPQQQPTYQQTYQQPQQSAYQPQQQPVYNQTTYQQQPAQQQSAYQPNQTEQKKENVFKRYYKHSGTNSLSILSVGYSTYFYLPNSGNPAALDAGKRHILNFEIFEWRAKCFGMQMFNFEMGLNTPSAPGDAQTRYMFERGGSTPNSRAEATGKTMWFAYKPAIKFYIPCTKWLAIELYGGAEVDITGVWYKISKKYYNNDQTIPDQNFFVNAFGGAGFVLTGVPALPLEIKAEYRHPLKGNTALVPQGVYLSAQLHLTAPIKKK